MSSPLAVNKTLQPLYTYQQSGQADLQHTFRTTFVIPFTGTVVMQRQTVMGNPPQTDVGGIMPDPVAVTYNIPYSRMGVHVSLAVSPDTCGLVGQNPLKPTVTPQNYISVAMRTDGILNTGRAIGCYDQSTCLYYSGSTLRSFIQDKLLVTQDNRIQHYCGQLDSSWQGDYTIREMSGDAGIFVGKYLYCIEASKFCNIMLSSVDDSYTLQYRKGQVVTPTGLQIMQDGQVLRLMTTHEAHGLGILQVVGSDQGTPGVAALKEQRIVAGRDDKQQQWQCWLELSDDAENAISGYYRVQQVFSPVYGGYYYSIITPETQSAVFSRVQDVRANYTYSRRLGGQRYQQSVACLVSRKTPYIAGLMYMQDIPGSANLEDSSDIPHASLDSVDMDVFIHNIAQIQEQYGYDIPQAYRSAYSELRKSTCHLTALMQRQVNPTNVVDVADQLPLPQTFISRQQQGERTRYKSQSLVVQLQDGSIVLKDGYGSEIQMIRGNIIISPALDLILRPGRNIIGTIPGLTSLTSQKVSVSSREATALISGGTLQVSSGVQDKTGGMVLKLGGSFIVDTKDIAIIGRSLYIAGPSESSGMFLSLHNMGQVSASAAQISLISPNINIIGTNELPAVDTATARASGLCIGESGIIVYGQHAVVSTSVIMQQVQGQVGVSGNMLIPFSLPSRHVGSLQIATRDYSVVYTMQSGIRSGATGVGSLVIQGSVQISGGLSVYGDHVTINGTCYARSLAQFKQPQLGINSQQPFYSRQQGRVLTFNDVVNSQRIYDAGTLFMSVPATSELIIKDGDRAERLYADYDICAGLPDDSQYNIGHNYRIYHISWQCHNALAGMASLNPLHYTIAGIQYYEYPGKTGWTTNVLVTLNQESDGKISEKDAVKLSGNYPINYTNRRNN